MKDYKIILLKGIEHGNLIEYQEGSVKDDSILENMGWTIKSVRRLNDGVLFELGDEVSDINEVGIKNMKIRKMFVTKDTNKVICIGFSNSTIPLYAVKHTNSEKRFQDYTSLITEISQKFKDINELVKNQHEQIIKLIKDKQ